MLPPLLLRDTLGRGLFSMEEVRRTGGGGFCDWMDPRRDNVPLLMVQYPAQMRKRIL